MTLLQQIFTWTQDLPTWQSDAVSRLLSNEILTGPDKDNLYALLKALECRDILPISSKAVFCFADRATSLSEWLAISRGFERTNRSTLIPARQAIRTNVQHN
jgi:hypothetical protein